MPFFPGAFAINMLTTALVATLMTWRNFPLHSMQSPQYFTNLGEISGKLVVGRRNRTGDAAIPSDDIVTTPPAPMYVAIQ